MKNNYYLYGDATVPEIPKEVVKVRIELLKSNLATVLAVSYAIRDSNRVNDIVKAIKFWENINES